MPEIVDVGGKADGLGKDAIDPSGLCIGGPSPRVGSVNAPDGWRRQHRQKLTIFSPYG
jgi:hypothetical protein